MSERRGQRREVREGRSEKRWGRSPIPGMWGGFEERALGALLA